MWHVRYLQAPAKIPVDSAAAAHLQSDVAAGPATVREREELETSPGSASASWPKALEIF